MIPTKIYGLKISRHEIVVCANPTIRNRIINEIKKKEKHVSFCEFEMVQNGLRRR